MCLGRRAGGRQRDFYCFSSAKRHQWLLKRGGRRCLGSEHPLEPTPHPWHGSGVPLSTAPAPCRALKSAIFYLYISGNSAALCTLQGINVFSKFTPSVHSSLNVVIAYPCADNKIRHHLWGKYKAIKNKALFVSWRRINHLILDKDSALFPKTSHAPEWIKWIKRLFCFPDFFISGRVWIAGAILELEFLIIICKWKILRQRISVN